MSDEYVYTRVSITFKDVAACFSEDEWALLEDWQKELFKHVMMEIHGVLNSLGYGIANPYTVFKIKTEDDPDSWDHIYAKGNNFVDTCDDGYPMVNPDILLSLTAVKESHKIVGYECEKETQFTQHQEPERCESVTNPYMMETIRSEMNLDDVPQTHRPCRSLSDCDKENSSLLNTSCKIETFSERIATPPLKEYETQPQMYKEATLQSPCNMQSEIYKGSPCQIQCNTQSQICKENAFQSLCNTQSEIDEESTCQIQCNPQSEFYKSDTLPIACNTHLQMYKEGDLQSPCNISQICNDDTLNSSHCETHLQNYDDSTEHCPDETQSQDEKNQHDSHSQNTETILHSLYETAEPQLQNQEGEELHDPYETQPNKNNDDDEEEEEEEDAGDVPCESELQHSEDGLHTIHESLLENAESILLSLYEVHEVHTQNNSYTVIAPEEPKTQNDKENTLKNANKKRGRKPGRIPKKGPGRSTRRKGERPVEGANAHGDRTVSVIQYSTQLKREFQCTECSRSYSDHSSLLLHQKLHRLEQSFACRGAEKGKRPYKCSRCDQRFSRESTLIVHMRLHTVERPFKCTYCEKCFKQSSGLVKHIRKHTGEKPYKCTECGKCFSRSSCLGIHRRIHTGEKPYKCADCEKSFTQSYSLIKHQRTHTGVKPYKCNICDKCFNQKQHLQKHQKSHTTNSGNKIDINKWFMCTLCLQCFDTKDSLHAHHKIHKKQMEAIPSVKKPKSVPK
ncbi:zinc finger protein 879-like [Ambystoma mexicanum]|uniref:zinc finger protein 879-like n=1 Tax=Ambystoma mexicanum TaxID=8296 RepID=UPI0037E7C781